MAFPPVHFLIGATAAECVRGGRAQPWKGWALGGLVAVVPDLDSAVLLTLGHEAPTHGLYTHTLAATVVVGLLVGVVAGRRWGLVAGSAWASHLLADLLRASSKTSDHLWWPYASEALAPLAPVFAVIPFEWEDGLPVLYGPDPVGVLVRQCLLGAAAFVGVVAVSFLMRRR